MCPDASSGSSDVATGRPLLASNAAFGAILAVVFLVVLYSLLIVQQPLLGAMVAAWVIGIYVVWRFVRWFTDAYERRTAAMEAMADSMDRMADDGTGPAFDRGGDDEGR